MDERPPYDVDAPRAALLERCCARCCRRRSTGGPMLRRVPRRCGRRAPGWPMQRAGAAGASVCCCASAPTAAGRRSRPGWRSRRPARRCSPARCCRAGRRAQPRFQRAFAGLAERRESSADDFWSWRDRMYGVALRIGPEQLRAVAAQLYVELLAGGYTQVCEFHYCSTTATAARTRIRSRCRGRWPTRPPRRASA